MHRPPPCDASRRSPRRLAWRFWAGAAVGAALGLGVLAASPAAADEPARVIDPRWFGLAGAAGPLRPGAGRLAAALTPSGERAVCRVVAEIGGGRVLLAPDGSLFSLPAGETEPAEGPFAPETGEALAARLAADEYPGFRPTVTRRYVLLSAASPEFTAAAARILETLLPGVAQHARAWGLETRAPEFPLVVVMFATEAEMRDRHRTPAGAAAFYSVLTNRIYLCERPDRPGLAPELVLQQTLAAAAHEGAHQALQNVGVQQRLALWPLWVNEGLAEYFAPTTFNAKLEWKGAGQVHDLRLSELEHFLAGRGAEAEPGMLVEQTVAAPRLTSTGYAAAWALVHYLVKNDRAGWTAYLKQLAARGPLEGEDLAAGPAAVGLRRLGEFEAGFGDDRGELEHRLLAHLRRLPYRDPFAAWPHYAACITVMRQGRATRFAAFFKSQTQAEDWLRDMQAGIPAEDAAPEKVREFPNRAAAESFVRQWQASRP